MRRVLLTVAVTAVVALAGCAGGANDTAGGAPAAGGGDAGQNVGVAVGGAQDANTFRRNVEEGYVPQPTDLTDEGLFHDYYFDTAGNRTCEARFCPSYSPAVTRDPLSNETERFVTVGLNSGISRADFERKPLNLVVVVDTSGSMGDPFDDYYYDGGTRRAVEENQRKMEAASEAVVSMLGHLDGSDRVAVVGYDDRASVVQDLRRVGEIDRGDLRSSVRGLSAGGGTNLDAGMRTARDLLGDRGENTERETRVVYVTDAMPNLGDTGGDSLQDRLQTHSRDGVHSTFVGVGVDFNSRLTEAISTVKGANYYGVDSPTGFDERMDEGFSYMVTPLVYNLSLTVETEGYSIEAVYGSPQADRSSATLTSVTTLFPSRREGNRTEGGVVLLEVAKETENATLQVHASYENPDGTARETTRTVNFERYEAPYYGSTGVRKAVALSEYATLLRNWAVHERRSGGEPEAPAPDESIEHRGYDGQWEQDSVDLTVTAPYGERIRSFVPYFRAQKRALGADRMQQDLDVLRWLVDAHAAGGDSGPGSVAEPAAESVEQEGVGTDEDDGAEAAEDDGTAALSSATAASADASNGLWSTPVGRVGPLVGMLNLAVTVLVAAYGIRQKRRSRDRDLEVKP